MVDEAAARTVATGVALLAWTVALGDVRWLVVPLAYGFIARVVAGPRYSPLALVATRVVARRHPGRLVPGPPKRFAQAMGVGFSVTAAVLFLAGQPSAARVVIGLLASAATLEAVFGFCLGCKVFALGMRLGLVPASTCERCVVG